MTAVDAARLRVFSDSHVKQPAQFSASSQHWSRRASSAPSTQARGSASILSSSRTCVRGAERRSAPRLRWAPFRGVPACLYGTHAFRRSTGGDLSRYPRSRFDRTVRDKPFPKAALPWPFTRSRPATEGGPLIGDGRWHRTLGRGNEPRLQAPHPAPSAERLRKTPSVSGTN